MFKKLTVLQPWGREAHLSLHEMRTFVLDTGPMARNVAFVDPMLGPVSDDQITRDFRIYQRAKGHRFSTDDIATAYVAHEHKPQAKRILDLGCGIGSVILQLAWTLPEARFVGVEAQAISFELLRRNVHRNELSERVVIHHGDLRDEQVIERLGSSFELITGTPPYFPPETALDAMDEQRAFARIEYRGGVEAYVRTGVRLLAQNGRMVMCGDAEAEERVQSVLKQHNLHMVERVDLIPYEGRPVLFAIWVFGHAKEIEEKARVRAIVLNDRTGKKTEQANALRAFSGFGPHPE